jgi:hypothetical protein
VVYLQAPGHLVGFGGRVGGSNVGFGASARAWSHDRFGVQFDLTRVAMAGLAPTERVTSMQFEPGVLYTLADHVADYIWVRPYAGSGLTIGRRSLSSTIPGAAPVASESHVGVQAFGGTELTFASVPRFAVSVDVAYRWGTMEFAGIDLGRVGLSVAGTLVREVRAVFLARPPVGGRAGIGAGIGPGIGAGAFSRVSPRALRRWLPAPAGRSA